MAENEGRPQFLRRYGRLSRLPVRRNLKHKNRDKCWIISLLSKKYQETGMILPRVLMVGERLTGTKELLFFDGRRGYKTDLDWYFDKSLAAAWKLNFKLKLAF